MGDMLVLLCGFAACPLFAFLSLAISLPEMSDVQLRVSARGIEIHRNASKRIIERARIVGAFVVPHAECGVEFTLTNGNVLRIVTPHVQSANAIIEHLGFGLDEHRVTMRLASQQRQLAAGCAALPAMLIVGWAVVKACNWLGVPLDDAPRLILAFVATIGTMLVVRARRPPEIVIGKEGFVVCRSFGKEYFPFASWGSAVAKGSELRLRGRVIARGEPALVRAAASRIKAARDAPDGDEGDLALGELLERGARSASEWQKSLRALTKDAGYRHTAITPEALRGMLANPEEDPERRVGAAMLLRIASPSDTPCIRIAADTCADDNFRAVLEAAAEGEVNDAILQGIARKRD